MSRIVLSPLAQDDLDEIWEYSFAQWGYEQAETYSEKLREMIRQVSERPQKGRPRDYVRSGYFQAAVGSHFLFYVQLSDGIDVKRILHQSMDFQRHL